MKDITPVDLSEVQGREQSTDANVRIGRYKMDEHCPLSEFKCYRVVLEQADMERIFLLPLDEFKKHTKNQTSKIVDLLPTAADDERVRYHLENNLDLRSATDFEIEIVTNDLEKGALTIIDGNHRAMAHCLRHNDLVNVPVYICVHPNINAWSYIPQLAKIYTP